MSLLIWVGWFKGSSFSSHNIILLVSMAINMFFHMFVQYSNVCYEVKCVCVGFVSWLSHILCEEKQNSAM